MNLKANSECPVCGGTNTVFEQSHYEEPPYESFNCKDCSFAYEYIYPMEYLVSYITVFLKEPTSYEDKNYITLETKDEKDSINVLINKLDSYLKDNNGSFQNSIQYNIKYDSLKEEHIKKSKLDMTTIFNPLKEAQNKVMFELNLNKHNNYYIRLGLISVDNQSNIILNEEAVRVFASNRYKMYLDSCRKNSQPSFIKEHCIYCRNNIFGIKIQKVYHNGVEYLKVIEPLNSDNIPKSNVSVCPICSKTYVD